MFSALALVSIVSLVTPSGILSTTELAIYLKLIGSNAGCPGRIACRDVDVAMQLKKDGISVDSRSIVAWASTENQVTAFTESNKFVICANPEFLQKGACLAIFRERGKIILVLNIKNARATGIQLSPDLIKVAKII